MTIRHSEGAKKMNKRFEKKKLKEYALLFNTITNALEIIEKAQYELTKAQKEALTLYCESADKLNIDTRYL